MSMQPLQTSRRQPDSLADVLERVLDKGIVIAGDVVVNVLDIELLTLKLRLFIASADTAREMGMDWWTDDPFFNSQARQREVEQGDGQRRRAVNGSRTARSDRQLGRSSAEDLQAENARLREQLEALQAQQQEQST
jgi:hypothetical protein